jgi:hypothetical protein
MNAFTPDQFDRLLNYDLDVKRYDIAKVNGDYPTIVFEVIESAVRSEWMLDLVRAARKANSKNVMLQAFIKQHPEHKRILDEEKRRELEEKQAELWKQYNQAVQQSNSRIGNIERARAEAEPMRIYGLIEEVDEELTMLEAEQVRQTRQAPNWHSNLPKIDFKEAVNLVQDIIINCSDQCSALFLIQNSLVMGGGWCASRIRELLDEATGDLKYYPVEFTFGSQLNEQGVLDLLGRYVDVEPTIDDLSLYSQTIIGKICGSLRSGNIVFIEIRGWEFIIDRMTLIEWFMKNFWAPLVRRLPMISKTQRRVKLVAVLVMDDQFITGTPPTLYSTKDEFHAEKILELPLQNWTSDEIQNWLETYSGLKAHEIDALVKKVYGASMNGLPQLVYDALSKHLPQEG